MKTVNALFLCFEAASCICVWFTVQFYLFHHTDATSYSCRDGCSKSSRTYHNRDVWNLEHAQGQGDVMAPPAHCPTPMRHPAIPPCAWNSFISKWDGSESGWAGQKTHIFVRAMVPHCYQHPLLLPPITAPFPWPWLQWVKWRQGQTRWPTFALLQLQILGLRVQGTHTLQRLEQTTRLPWGVGELLPSLPRQCHCSFLAETRQVQKSKELLWMPCTQKCDHVH